MDAKEINAKLTPAAIACDSRDLIWRAVFELEFAVNMKTAKTLGLKIPNSILVQATKIIE